MQGPAALMMIGAQTQQIARIGFSAPPLPLDMCDFDPVGRQAADPLAAVPISGACNRLALGFGRFGYPIPGCSTLRRDAALLHGRRRPGRSDDRTIPARTNVRQQSSSHASSSACWTQIGQPSGSCPARQTDGHSHGDAVVGRLAICSTVVRIGTPHGLLVTPTQLIRAPSRSSPLARAACHLAIRAPRNAPAPPPRFVSLPPS